MIRQLLRSTAAAALVAISAATAGAQSYVFSTSTGVQPATVGTITITQLSGTSVNVFVDLLAGYGFLNTGGKVPFALNIQGSEVGLDAVFTEPAGGVAPNGTFTFTTNDATNVPFGNYLQSVTYSAGNGSGQAYYGDLNFVVTRASGLSIDDFGTNGTYYFSADLTDGQNTGSQAWAGRTGGGSTGSVVPEPSTYVLLGSGLVGLVGFTSRRRRNG